MCFIYVLLFVLNNNLGSFVRWFYYDVWVVGQLFEGCSFCWGEVVWSVCLVVVVPEGCLVQFYDFLYVIVY